MPALQSLGIGSGLDANSIVTQLLAIERQPLARLQKAANGIQAEISAFGSVRSKLDALDSSAAALSSASTWSATKVSSSDPAAMTVTALDTSEPQTLDIEISNLAKAQSVSTPYLNPPPLPATGPFTVGTPQTLKIELGTWSGGSFTASGSVNVDLLATDNLSSVKDKINGSSAGVSATILNDAGGSRLVIRSNDTGTANGFRIHSYVPGSGPPPDPSPDERFAFTNPSNSDPTKPVMGQAGADLSGKVNGAAIVSSANTLTNLVDGVTVTVLKTTGSSVKVSVEKDVEAIKSKINAFTTAYNDLIAFLREQTKYNETTKTGATLQGDRLAVGLQGQVRSAMTSATAASGVFQRLNEVGIQLQRDGSLTVNASKLDSSLENLSEVAELFSRDDTSASSDGVAVRVSDLLDDLTSGNGALTGKTEALRSRLARNQDEQDRLSDRLALVEARLKAQYTSLDEKMASLTGLNQYVSQQMQMISNAGNQR